MSEFINNGPIEPEEYEAPMDNPEIFINTAEIPIIAEIVDQQESDEAESANDDYIELDFDDNGSELAVLDPREQALRSPIDEETLESIHAHDMVIAKRNDDVEQLAHLNIEQGVRQKDSALTLSKNLIEAAKRHAEANKQIIDERTEQRIRAIMLERELAYAEVETERVNSLTHAEMIQNAVRDIYKTSNDLSNQVVNAVLYAKDKQISSIERRDDAIETKNKRIEQIAEINQQISELEDSIRTHKAIIIRHELVQAEKRSTEVECLEKEHLLLGALKEVIIAIKDRELAGDTSASTKEKYDPEGDPGKFLELLRAVREDDNQMDIKDPTTVITSGDLLMAFEVLNQNNITDYTAAEWFDNQSLRRLNQMERMKIQQAIDGEEANVKADQYHINLLNKEIATLEADRDEQHKKFEFENQEMAANFEYVSTFMKNVVELQHSIMSGDTSQATEGTIEYKIRDRKTADSFHQLIEAVRRLQSLKSNLEDLGENMPVLPRFDDITADLPPLEQDVEDEAIRRTEATDQMIAKIENFKLFSEDKARAQKVSGALGNAVNNLVVKVDLPGLFKKGRTLMSITAKDENQEG